MHPISRHLICTWTEASGGSYGGKIGPRSMFDGDDTPMSASELKINTTPVGVSSHVPLLRATSYFRQIFGCICAHQGGAERRMQVFQFLNICDGQMGAIFLGSSTWNPKATAAPRSLNYFTAIFSLQNSPLHRPTLDFDVNWRCLHPTAYIAFCYVSSLHSKVMVVLRALFTAWSTPYCCVPYGSLNIRSRKIFHVSRVMQTTSNLNSQP